MLSGDHADDHVPGLGGVGSRSFFCFSTMPQLLSLHEVDPVLGQVDLALLGVELELELRHGDPVYGGSPRRGLLSWAGANEL